MNAPSLADALKHEMTRPGRAAALTGASCGGAHSSNSSASLSLGNDVFTVEAFVEKRFGDRFVVRLSAQNLLDKEKRETFMKYDGDSIEEILDNRANGDLDEYELESERSGVLYQVTIRAAF